jgi:hypothetical protein
MEDAVVFADFEFIFHSNSFKLTMTEILQKQAWLDIFLAEFLAQIKEGRTVEEILSFW